MHRLFLVAGAVGVLAVFAWAAHDDAFDFPYIPLDHAAIDYDNRPLDDAITRLQRRLDSGEVKLTYEAEPWRLSGQSAEGSAGECGFADAGVFKNQFSGD